MCLEENSRVAKSTEPDLDLFLNAVSLKAWFSLKQIDGDYDDDDDDYDEKVPGDEEGNETPEQLRTYFTLNDNLKPVGVRRQLIVSLEQYWWLLS